MLIDKVYPGVGWVFWRSPEYLPEELIFNVNYLGSNQATFTLNFSKGASHVIGQYYQLIRLGKHGYRSIMENLTKVSDYLADELKRLGFLIMSDGKGRGLPLVAFRMKPDDDRLYDEFALAHVLRQRGWIIPAYTMAPHSNQLKMMRVVLREDFTMHRCNILLEDIKAALKSLEEMDAEMIQKYTLYVLDPTNEEYKLTQIGILSRTARGDCHSNMHITSMKNTHCRVGLGRRIVYVDFTSCRWTLSKSISYSKAPNAIISSSCMGN